MQLGSHHRGSEPLDKATFIVSFAKVDTRVEGKLGPKRKNEKRKIRGKAWNLIGERERERKGPELVSSFSFIP